MSETVDKSSVKYLYVRDNLRRPLLTVVYTMEYTDGGIEVRVGWATSNFDGTYDEEKKRVVKDRCSKEVGRQIAMDRLVKIPAVFWMLATGGMVLTRRLERAAVLRTLLRDKYHEIPTHARKHLTQRIQALETEKKVQEVNGEPLFTAEVKNDAVYTKNWVNGNGPLPLSWLVKKLKEGEWKVTRVK